MMSKHLFQLSGAFVFLVAFCPAGRLQAQTASPASDDDKVYLVVEQMPQFQGGDGGFQKFISDNLTYPSQDLANAVEGRVFYLS